METAQQLRWTRNCSVFGEPASVTGNSASIYVEQAEMTAVEYFWCRMTGTVTMEAFIGRY